MLEFLNAEDVLFGQRYDSLQEAIRGAGSILEKKKYILPAYIDAMLALIEEFGPYIVIMPHIALAHARPEGRVVENSVSLVTCMEGIESGNKPNDPVFALFAIAAKTDKEFLGLFRDVAEFLVAPGNVERLLKAECYDDLYAEAT